MSEVPLHERRPSCTPSSSRAPPAKAKRATLRGAACEDRVLDGPASGEKGFKGGSNKHVSVISQIGSSAMASMAFTGCERRGELGAHACFVWDARPLNLLGACGDSRADTHMVQYDPFIKSHAIIFRA